MKSEHLKELCRALTKVHTVREALAVLKDLLTPKELTSVVERLQLVKLLLKGMPQRTISKKLKISIMKVTRGSRTLKRSSGGFLHLLKKT